MEGGCTGDLNRILTTCYRVIGSIARNEVQPHHLSVATKTQVIVLKSDGTLSSGGNLKRVQTDSPLSFVPQASSI